jgi:hypothetical protein
VACAISRQSPKTAWYCRASTDSISVKVWACEVCTGSRAVAAGFGADASSVCMGCACHRRCLTASLGFGYWWLGRCMSVRSLIAWHMKIALWQTLSKVVSCCCLPRHVLMSRLPPRNWRQPPLHCFGIQPLLDHPGVPLVRSATPRCVFDVWGVTRHERVVISHA